MVNSHDDKIRNLSLSPNFTYSTTQFHVDNAAVIVNRILYANVVWLDLFTQSTHILISAL